MSEQAVELEHRITPLELFFDLVFVFAFTQATAVFVGRPDLGAGWARAADPRRALVGVGVVCLADEHRRRGQDAVLAAVFVAMAAMFVAALAVPEAFGDHGVLFGVAFLLVAVMHLALYALSARSEPELFVAILRIVPGASSARR